MKKLRSRKNQRGAVFVEAIIVIAFFTLCFLGVAYFRELYLGKMRVQRLARASALAHAMGACDVDAKAGLENDLPPNSPAPANKEPGQSLELDPKAGTPADSLEGFGRSKAGTPLDEITAVTVATTAAVESGRDSTGKTQGFTSAVSATSFVTCADAVSDGQFDEILPHIESVFESFFGK